MSAAPLPRVLVSACLLGEPVRHDGGSRGVRSAVLAQWQAEGRIVACCPELAGGLAVPRPAAEIQGPGDGVAVLSGNARVQTGEGADVTGAYVAGAKRALELVRQHHIRVAVLKERSPSCGTQQIHAGHFHGQLREGMGVTAALLRQHGVAVFNENQWDEAQTCLRAFTTP